ncbi:hypothetical protein L484_007392 [Morus notabilis]|uniref:Uncharacterized protein n=1 Tax=Morus notabilis TaxID=981085 RepID=W9QXR8_9ROSA|nr:hypothetical protein L484_007392 [Morus notabilis]
MKFSNQAHHLPKPNLVDATCLNCKNHAKLEGITIKDPFVVLYDTYYGRVPLFTERLSKRPSLCKRLNS